MPPTNIEMVLSEVRAAVPAGPGVEAGLVVIQEAAPPSRMLRIVIGQPEARAIQTAWQNQLPTRPSTWDLYVSTLDLLGGELTAAVITAVVEERHFFAVLELARDGDILTVPCRPSDAIALAQRVPGARIVAASEVLDAAGLLADGTRAGAAKPSVGDGPQVDESMQGDALSHLDSGPAADALAVPDGQPQPDEKPQPDEEPQLKDQQHPAVNERSPVADNPREFGVGVGRIRRQVAGARRTPPRAG